MERIRENNYLDITEVASKVVIPSGVLEKRINLDFTVIYLPNCKGVPTTLAADYKRRLIGDDEHGWSNQGIFNIAGRSYAQCIKGSQGNKTRVA